LVNNEFANMQQLTGRYLALHQSLSYVPPDSLDNDPLNENILSCARSLASLAAGSQFQDVAVCH